MDNQVNKRLVAGGEEKKKKRASNSTYVPVLILSPHTLWKLVKNAAGGKWVKDETYLG